MSFYGQYSTIKSTRNLYPNPHKNTNKQKNKHFYKKKKGVMFSLKKLLFG